MKLTGMDKLLKALNDKQDISDVKRVVKMNGYELEGSMKRNASFIKGYQTGTTKRSMRLVYEDGGLTVKVFPTTEYAPYLEYGTRFMTAQPFVRQSYYSQFFQFQEDLKRLMK